MDLVCSLIVLGVAAIAAAAIGARKTQTMHSRVIAEGSGPLTGAMLNRLYGIVAVIGDACVACGITANAITASSLVTSGLAALLFAAGHLGAGALLALIAAASDALDGYVARRMGQAGDAGELLDAAVDRYVEFALFAGLALHLRANVLELALVLTAYAGSFMVSYSSAKAEALHITPPRGGMRRTERVALLIIGAAFTAPLALLGLDAFWAEAPLLLALVAIAVFAHVSAVLRFAHLVRALRTRDRAHADSAPESLELGLRDRSRG